MQAAGGASLDAQGPQDAEGPPSASLTGRRTWWLFAGIAAVAYGLDLLTKLLAVEHLSDGLTRPLVGDLLQLHLTRNPGAAFSAGTEYTPVLSVVALVAAVVVLWLSRRVGSRLWALGLGLLLAGVVGNLTDRLFRDPGPFHGHVVDFLMLPNWPIFNVADICINLAAAVIVVQAFRGIRLDGTREVRREEQPDEPPESHA